MWRGRALLICCEGGGSEPGRERPLHWLWQRAGMLQHLPCVTTAVARAAADDDDEEAASDLGGSSAASTGPSRNASVASFDVDDQPPPGCAARRARCTSLAQGACYGGGLRVYLLHLQHRRCMNAVPLLGLELRTPVHQQERVQLLCTAPCEARLGSP